MRVLQINGVCGIRSTGRIATNIASSVEEQGGKCKIAFGRNSVPEEYSKYSIRIGNTMDVLCNAAIARLTDKAGFETKRATSKFIEQLEEYNPDIIHLHNIHGYYINVEVLFQYLKRAGKPVVWTLHDCWPFTGHCTHFDYVGCEKWKSGCHSCQQMSSYPKSIILDNSAWNFKRKKELFSGIKNMVLVTPSYWLKSLVLQSFLSEYETAIINNGIDLNVFKPIESQFKIENSITNKKMILSVASTWAPRKGLDDFVELSKLLDDDYRIVLVGLSEQQRRKLPPNILGILQTKSMEELVKIYSAADVFVNLSTEETMGMTTVEAVACGTPVVVYDATAIPEVLNANCGFIVKKKDIVGAAAAIRKVNKSDQFTNCIKRATNFDAKDSSRKYIELYKRLMHPNERICT